MWIVQLALRRPYTFVVMALLILLLGAGAIYTTPTDIFPEIEIPVVTVIWTYTGLPANEMEKRIAIYSEYAISANVNNIRTIQSQTIDGVSVIRVYFHPSVKIEQALAQVTAISQAILRRMPQGALPPIILRYNASTVPVLQLSLSSKTLSESEIYDFGIYKLRQQLAPIQGITLPTPYGGKVRQIMVDIDPEKLHARGLSPLDVMNAVNAQNLTLPTGRARIGARDYTVSLNSTPEAVEAFNDIPVKYADGSWVLMRDVASVRDGFAVQQNVVRKDGTRGCLVTILKGEGASTLQIVNDVKALLPQVRASAPEGLEIELLADQSLFITAAIQGVLTESVIAACLTGAMILAFLGSWRSTLIITISIPLSILCSIVLLSALGHSLNVMTLGGLALAVGMLVDDATVEIENVHRNRALGKPLQQAILDGAQQIATPTFVGTLTVCIVFVSVVFLEGPAKYLFTPLALAVVFAMLASYLLSRTLVPVLVKYLLRGEEVSGGVVSGEWSESSSEQSSPLTRHHSPLTSFYNAFNRAFNALGDRYVAGLEWALDHRPTVLALFGLLVAAGAALLPFVGRDFFPTVDAGQLRLHVNAPPGTRLEETQKLFTAVEEEIRQVIPSAEVDLIVDNIGVPPEAFNLAFGDSATLGQADGEILVSLKEGEHAPTADYVRELRRRLPARLADARFYFQPPDITSQILNFGLAAPIDVRVQGFDRDANYKIARQLEARVRGVRGASDVHLHQVTDAPDLFVEVDRTRAAGLRLAQQQVANDVLVSLSGTTQVTPNYWLDPKSGIPYLISVQTPPHLLDSTDALRFSPLFAAGRTEPALLANLAQVRRRNATQVATHSDIQPTFDVLVNVQDRDLGGVSGDIDRVVRELQSDAPPTTRISVEGQVGSMRSAFVRLGIGIVFAAVLVYLLMVVNFQSWTDPFVIITALPGGMTGIVWMLYVTQTTFSVPSLMGTIMCVGVATANSILLITFANDQRTEGKDALEAARKAGRTRLRPVLMTAAAMILGMLPMSLGLGEGGEQNAPLVIGGLLLATFSTLFVVPVIYSLLRRTQPVAPAEGKAAQNTAAPFAQNAATVS